MCEFYGKPTHTRASTIVHRVSIAIVRSSAIVHRDIVIIDVVVQSAHYCLKIAIAIDIVIASSL